MRRLIAVAATSCAALALGAGTASAQDAWPVDPGQGAPVRPADATGYVLTADQPQFFNPGNFAPRVISPFGHNKVVCTGFRNVDDCWQADLEGNPRHLRLIFGLNLGFIQVPNVFIFPGMIPGS